jgi:hypothetical protein
MALSSDLSVTGPVNQRQGAFTERSHRLCTGRKCPDAQVLPLASAECVLAAHSITGTGLNWVSPFFIVATMKNAYAKKIPADRC